MLENLAIETVPPFDKNFNDLEWLLHMMRIRGEYEYCNNLLNYQKPITFDHGYFYYEEGIIARKQKDYQKSIINFRTACSINPNNENNFIEYGITLYEMRQWKQSLHIFLRAETLLQWPDHRVYYYIGELLSRNYGQPQFGPAEAKQYFIRAIQHMNDIDSLKKLSSIYRNEYDYQKAIELLEKIVEPLLPDDIENLTDIALLYLKIDNSKIAFDKLLKVTKYNKQCPKALLALGAIIQQTRNDVEGALNIYKIIENDDQDIHELWSNIGLCFFKKKKFIAAIACLKKSNWITPFNYSCLSNLGLVYLSSEQYASAFQIFAAALNIKPDSGLNYMLLGICLAQLNDPNNAFLAFEQSALSADALKIPGIYLNFAIFCSQSNRLDISHKYLTKYQEITENQSLSIEYENASKKLMEIVMTDLKNNDEFMVEGQGSTDFEHL